MLLRSIRRRGKHAIVLLACCPLFRAAFAEASLWTSEFITPYGEGVDRIVTAAEERGWGSVADELLGNALYARDRGETHTENWYYLYLWASLYASEEAETVKQWIKRIEEAKLAHPNMPGQVPVVREPLGNRLSPQLRSLLLSRLDYGRRFFNFISPYDYLPAVLDTLEELRQDYPAFFEKYFNLALAIAAVYDVPPPPDWPHGQVSSRLLRRSLPEPGAAFSYWVESNEKRKAAFNLSLLPPEELKFVVDTPASREDLVWARLNVQQTLENFGEVYSLVEYDTGRAGRFQFGWPHSGYKLPAILEKGGICVDQAYFAAQCGKAKGIPTLIFRGAGLDGRHAWFGFMRDESQWDTGAGRADEDLYVTGKAHDPQTWEDLTDHKLHYLASGFHRGEYFRQCRLHTGFAGIYLKLERFEEAIAAAETAIRYESLCLPPWEILRQATAKHTGETRKVEEVLRRAANAFRGCPDIEARFRQEISEMLRERGEISRARRQLDILAVQHMDSRLDISLEQAAGHLRGAMASGPLADQMRTFRVLMLKLGQKGGIQTFDILVVPFIRRLHENGHASEARQMLDFARSRIQPAAGTQLDLNFRQLEDALP